ncbi:MAG: SAM-dependent methyltransferase [Tannerella sp.]|jgi:hypothetical protein|nr:SAM-dependent methyltransferase [Tannerella sp.]
MQMTDTLCIFIQEHMDDDLDRLLFSAARYPEVDVMFAVEQISIRRHIREKLPTWYANADLIFPSKITGEQCSSEQTAGYKQRLLTSEKHLCDLTGGLGVDTYFFSQKLERVSYVERNTETFKAAMYNFGLLQANNIHGYNETAEDYLEKAGNTDVFYIDPARRSARNTRVFELTDCEPDLLELMPVLLEKAPKVIAKLSPMLDIHHTLKLLPHTSEVHVVSVKNECKELLFVLKQDMVKEPVINCINYTAEKQEQQFCFYYSEEEVCSPLIADKVGVYLYEPNASVLKAGAYKQIARLQHVEKLHVSSHLYTSGELQYDFPGRIFRVHTVYPFNGKLCKTIARQIPKANLSVRNFPISVNELRKRTRIAEGGDVYLFATTLADGEKVLISCEKVTRQ